MHENIDLNLVYDNSEVWVFDKPAGLATQGGKGVQYSFDQLIEDNIYEKPYLVHRLDKDTAGLILVAKNSRAASRYSQFFKKNEVKKVYKAIVIGQFPPKMEIKTSIRDQQGNLQKAHTVATLVRQYGDFSLINLRLYTGRMHQIRIHLKGQNFPLVGDEKYGNFKFNRYLESAKISHNLMLFSSSLTIDAVHINLSLELPVYFKQFLKKAPTIKVANILAEKNS